MALHKELPQINQIRLFSIKGIGDHFGFIIKNHRLVFADKPVAHPVLKLGRTHQVAMPFVFDKLLVQDAQKVIILQKCAARLKHHGYRSSASAEATAVSTVMLVMQAKSIGHSRRKQGLHGT